MKTFKQFIEGVSDINQLKRKRLNDRTPRDQAFLNAYKKVKEKPKVAHVHIKYENGEIGKEKFKVTGKETAEDIAKNHFDHMTTMHKKFPEISSKPIEIVKAEIK